MWIQGLISFVVWLAYGLWLRKGSDRMKQTIFRKSRLYRVLLASIGFVGSAAIMLGGLFAVAAAGWVSKTGLTPIGWLAVTLLGVVFVHIQVLAAASMISIVQENEPEAKPQSSEQSS